MDSSALATVFMPRLGYAKVTELVKQSQAANRSFSELAIELGLLSEDDILETLVRSARHGHATADAPDAEGS